LSEYMPISHVSIKRFLFGLAWLGFHEFAGDETYHRYLSRLGPALAYSFAGEPVYLSKIPAV